MKIVIPMAGLGSRFRQLADTRPEYNLPKPLIKVKDIPMIKWSTASFPFLQQNISDNNKPVKYSDLIFICLREHEDEIGITGKLRELYSNDIKIIILDKLTRGAAETAYAAKGFIDTEEDVLIADSDNHLNAYPLWESIQAKDKDTVGILGVIQPPDSKPVFSYVAMKDSRFVVDVKEKDKKLAESGAMGILGLYYFSHGRDFINEAEKMFSENDLTGESGKQEFYMSQIYTRLLKKNKQVEIAKITEGWTLGTPVQLEFFLSNHSGKLPVH